MVQWHVLGCGPEDFNAKCKHERALKKILTTSTTPIMKTLINADSESIPSYYDLEDEGERSYSALGQIVMIAIIVLTVVSNLTLLGLFASKKKLRSTSNLFISSLALADLGVALTAMILSLRKYSSNDTWLAGEHLCQFWIFSDFFFCEVSVLNLVYISWNRFQAVKNPVKFSRQKTISQVCFHLSSSWALSFALTFPTVMTMLLDHFMVDYDKCQMLFNGRKWFVWFTALTCFFLPFLALASLYTAIFLLTRKSLDNKINKKNNSRSSRSQVHEKKRTKKFSETTTTLTSSLKENKNGIRKLSRNDSSQGVLKLEKKLQEFLSRERRMLKILVILVATFLACWAPFWLVYLLAPLCQSDWCQGIATNGHLHLFFQWLGYSNSLINPIIYTGFNREIRGAFVEFLQDIKSFLISIIVY